MNTNCHKDDLIILMRHKSSWFHRHFQVMTIIFFIYIHAMWAVASFHPNFEGGLEYEKSKLLTWSSLLHHWNSDIVLKSHWIFTVIICIFLFGSFLIQLTSWCTPINERVWISEFVYTKFNIDENEFLETSNIVIHKSPPITLSSSVKNSAE